MGPMGPTGPTGPRGPKGSKGDKGGKGDKGDKGDSSTSNIKLYRKMGRHELKAGSIGSSGNNSNIQSASINVDGKYLVSYYFTLRPTNIKIDRYNKEKGWESSIYKGTKYTLETSVYKGSTNISSLQITTDGTYYDHSFPHRAHHEALVDLDHGDTITLKSWSEDFGDLSSFLFYEVFDATLSVSRVG